MHHPDIHDILVTIQDLLLLSDDSSHCQIVPDSFYFKNEWEYKQRSRGFFLLRKLSGGLLKVRVLGHDEDDNVIVFEYLSADRHNEVVHSIEIHGNDYSIDRVQDAVREIVIMDKKKQLAPV